ITDIYLPYKAIDLIDEACDMIITEIDIVPTDMDDVIIKLFQLNYSYFIHSYINSDKILANVYFIL
ncbi:hypothetical protein, partial [Clostridium sp. HV4-5-A1G]|uniref:hypothetical protein n=1 Tax=Clostridium sp. HV4-5-A1G TaxID=2004595 RepID=UPI00168595A6